MEKQPVIILGLRKQALPIIRSLVQIGKYHVYCFIDSRTTKEEAEYTRYGEKIFFASMLDVEKKLKDIQTCYTQKLYIFITSAVLLTEIRTSLRIIYEEYKVSSSPLPWIDLFTNKALMYSFVKEYGVQTAPFVLLNQYTVGCLQFPVVLKRNIEHFLSFKVKQIECQSEFDEFVNAISDNRDDIIVQELVRGTGCLDLSYQGYFYDGTCKGSVVWEEVRHFPQGISCFMREVDGNLKQLVVNNTETFFKVTDYSGFVQIDYKYLPVEDKLIIMDVNTRTPASHSAFSYKFINYSDLFRDLDTPPVLIEKNAKIAWINIASDGLLKMKLRSRLEINLLFTAVWDVWSFKDLMPFIMSILLPIIRHFKGIIGDRRNKR